MTDPLLETKIHVPLPRRGLVTRRRLNQQLTLGSQAALTLISAPAGFGKSTLLASWLEEESAQDRLVAWLSLDARDNDPAVFWTYLVSALHTARADVGASALGLLASRQPPTEALIATVINDLQASPDDVVLVLDDYHVIESRDVHAGMKFLLAHQPPGLHLMISGRADPALPLSRLRSRGELVEIRSSDLRFTPDEAADYLNGIMGLTLAAQDVAALEARTEGWIAALQLAALSMQGRDDPAGFIAGFAGDDRYIVDYLAEEVLHRQSQPVKDFLLQTSILDRLGASLCDAVTGRDTSKSQLVALERANLFLIPLDDRRHWYRYHQLFGDVLHAHLLDEQMDLVPELHRRASTWFEHNGSRSEAIDHALAAEDFRRAADLVELSIPDMRQSRHEDVVLAWLMSLPDDVVRERPVLCDAFAGALLSNGRLDGVEARLQDAERWLEAGADEDPEAATAGMVVVHDVEFSRLAGSISVHRAGYCLIGGDLDGTVTHARNALAAAPEDDHLNRAAAAALLGLAAWSSGDLATAAQSYAESLARMRQAGHIADILGCSIALADIQRTQGHLGSAMRTYQRGLELAAEQVGPVPRGTADMHVGVSDISYERGNLADAREALLRGQQLGEHNGLPQYPYRWRVAMARIVAAEGDLDGAHDLLLEARRVFTSDFSPVVRPLPALLARNDIARGATHVARDWVRGRGLSADDDLDYAHEFEHITLARVLLSEFAAESVEGSLLDATRLLDRLLRAADEAGRTGSVVELLVLQARARAARGDRTAAVESLQRALALGEPEGYERVFIDEGPSLEPLLNAAVQQHGTGTYARRLLATSRATQRTTRPHQDLIEPLSERELDVLRLLRTDLSGPAIARELFVSLSTMRTHTRSIYAKLDVTNRRAAVRRAEELDLIT